MLAAGVATVVIVQKKRDDELKQMRGASQFELNMSREGLLSYWDWTVQSFSKMNRFVHSLLSPEKQVELTPFIEDETAAFSSDEKEL